MQADQSVIYFLNEILAAYCIEIGSDDCCVERAWFRRGDRIHVCLLCLLMSNFETLRIIGIEVSPFTQALSTSITTHIYSQFVTEELL